MSLNSSLVRWVLLCFLHCFAFVQYSATASENSSIFYPLPLQQQGQFIVAKQMFSGPAGGLWIHDIYGQLRFFDGQHILPRSGSVVDFPVDDVAYINNYFWFAQNNQVYRFSPSEEPELILSLSLTRTIEKIGTSGRFLWVAGKEFFYTYDTVSGQFTEYPLTFVYNRLTRSEVVINQAIFILNKWVLATTSGTYLSDGETFRHIKASGRAHVETIYFSPQRRELVIGTLQGARIVKIDDYLQSAAKILPSAKVITIEETDSAYWIGTENGIVAYRFLDEEIIRMDANFQDDYSLTGGYIYDLLNDGQGGIWIATNKGISYFSLFSRLFERVKSNQLKSSSEFGHINRVLSDTEGLYWIASDRGLYKLQPDISGEPKRVVSAAINDIVRQGEKLWLAMDDGLYQYFPYSDTVKKNRFPSQLQKRKINHLAFDDSGVLWVTTDSGLLRYFTEQSIVENLGYDWVTSELGPSSITHLYSGPSGSVWIGTGHGSYLYQDGKITLQKTSHLFGQTIDMLETENRHVWNISSHGLSRLDLDSTTLMDVPLYETDIKPLCVLSTDKGVWLTTSKGLSYYSDDGQLQRHFGAPFGLVNNEFLPDVCSVDESKEHFIFGSKLGVIYASETELLAAHLPESQVRVGQVLLDMKPMAYAPDDKKHYVFPHGKTLSFVIGVLPDFDIWSLEYRLLGSSNDTWTKFQGSQLTIDYLLPGEYELEIRTDSAVSLLDNPSRFKFAVSTPWFMSNWFVFFSSVGLLLAVGLFFYWRSRQVWVLNRKLKDKVELRTSQLKHQSDALLYSNVQLKKQLATRQSFIDVLALEAFNKLSQVIRVAPQSKEKKNLNQASQKLQQIMQLTPQKGKSQSVFELNAVCDAVLLAMKEDIAQHGVRLHFVAMSDANSIEVSGFNLDLVLHGVLYNALRRCKKGDEIWLSLATGTEGAGFVVTDNGRYFSKQEITTFNSIDKSELGAQSYALNDVSLAAIRQFVALGNGECKIFQNTKQENEVEVLWPLYDVRTIFSNSVLPDSDIKESHDRKGEEFSSFVTEKQDPWLVKVQGLVETNYHDPEFGTAQMAKLLFTSERSLQRKFKGSTGKTFKEYLNEVRLEQACQLLIAGHRVADVAFDSGFNDPSYFSQRFRHHYGISPSKFIETGTL